MKKEFNLSEEREKLREKMELRMKTKIKVSDALYLHINKLTKEVILTHDKERDDYSGSVIYFDEIPNLIKCLKLIK